MMPRHLLALVLCLAGGAISAVHRYVMTPFDFYHPTNPKRFKVTNYSDSIIVTLTVPSEFRTIDNKSFLTTDRSAASITSWLSNRSALTIKNATILAYESNNCNTQDGKIRGTDLTPYLTAGIYHSRLYCRYYSYGLYNCHPNGWGTPAEPSNALVVAYETTPIYVDFPKQEIDCMKRTSINLSHNAIIRADEGTVTDTCSFGTRGTCNLCSWPYLSEPDSVGCGCKVDRSKYQSQQLLQGRAALYCNTYDDGTGTQYWLDLSRSNFDPSKGSIRGACSAPGQGTVYVPSTVCPTGTRIVDSVSDTTGQDAEGTIDEPTSSGSTGTGIGSDTATHSRLDSILGFLRDTNGLGELWQEPDLDAIGDSLQSAADPIMGRIDSLSISRNGTSGPWTATEPWPDTIKFNYSNAILGAYDTTLIVSWVIPGMPIDLWATFRWIEWVFVTLSMVPLMVRIAAGNEDA